MILAGDIGGTNVRLALFELVEDRLVEKRRERFPSASFPGLEAVAERFLTRSEEVEAAGFGIAGPVRDGRSEATNLPWIVDARLVAARLGLSRVALVNDLTANGLGLSELLPSDFAVINAGEEDLHGNAALISAGTGLGEALLMRQKGGRFKPLPSEGGHASFAPRDEHEAKLLLRLRERFGHVSWERLLSGPGLANVYRFEREVSGVPEPAWLSDEIAARKDVAAAVSPAGLEGRDEVAARALHRFVSLYGAAAGDLALTALSTGGVFVGGGIGPKIRTLLLQGAFFAAFSDKGRLEPLLSKIPVKLVTNDGCALLGAARAAVERP